jgi:hypothetical protein
MYSSIHRRIFIDEKERDFDSLDILTVTRLFEKEILGNMNLHHDYRNNESLANEAIQSFFISSGFRKINYIFSEEPNKYNYEIECIESDIYENFRASFSTTIHHYADIQAKMMLAILVRRNRDDEFDWKLKDKSMQRFNYEKEEFEKLHIAFKTSK